MPNISLINPINPCGYKYEGQLLPPLNLDIIALNRLIALYNIPSEAPNHLLKLRAIYKKKKEIENKYRPNMVSHFSDYVSQIHCTLFTELQDCFKEVGILSLLEDAIYSDDSPNPNQPFGTLPELLANMAPEKISNLMKHLSSKPAPKALKNPYRRDESGYPAFQTLIDTHAFRFLGGENSRNYKIINRATLAVVVLKVENRLGEPKAAEATLRAGVLRDILTPIAVERNAIFLDASNNPVAGTLIVTDYCTGGNLYHHSHHQLDANVRLTSALDIYSQMATILNTLSLSGFLFSDMKNENWLLTHDGKLQIADPKSFLPIRCGVYNSENAENTWYTFTHTNYMNPPEFALPPVTFSADKALAFMLGINIYDYLCQANEAELDALNVAPSGKFSHPIFKSEVGIGLKKLIKKLLKTDPASRASVQEALTELAGIQSLSIIAGLRKSCHALLLEIEQKAFGLADYAMQDYTTQMVKEINQASTQAELNSLMDTLTTVNEDTVISAAHNIYRLLRQGDRWYSVGINKKCQAIELAMREVPILERGNLFNLNPTLTAIAVQKAFASHRHWNRGGPGNVYLTTAHAIDEKNAAESFMALKAKLAKLKSPADQVPFDDPSQVKRLLPK